MPTIITHGFAGLIGGKIFSDAEKTKFWILSALVPMIPDADVVAFRFGIPYDSMFGHRGFSHSILFALIITLTVMLGAFREMSFGAICGLFLLDRALASAFGCFDKRRFGRRIIYSV